MINVDEAIAKIKKNFEQLSEMETSAGIVSAINKTIQAGITEARRGIQGSYNIKIKDVQDAFATKYAKPSLQIGELSASPKSISLSHFQPTFSFNRHSKTSYSKNGVGATRLLKGNAKAFGQGVSFEVVKGQKKVLPYAFMIAGKMPIFARGAYTSKGNYDFVLRHNRSKSIGNDTPITSMVTVSVYSAVVSKNVMPTVGTKMYNDFEKKLNHEFEWRLNKMKV
jgi:hypothetical protein